MDATVPNGIPRHMLSFRYLSVCLSCLFCPFLSVCLWRYVYCGQTVGWIKIKLGMEAGLGHIVLYGDPAPPPTAAQPRNFRPMSVVANGWLDQDATWYGGRPRPRPHCASWKPSSPPQKGAQPPIFGPCLLWKNGWMDQDVIYLVWR